MDVRVSRLARVADYGLDGATMLSRQAREARMEFKHSVVETNGIRMHVAEALSYRRILLGDALR